MALAFQHRAEEGAPERIALFPGAWNPPTVAHVAMARAALEYAGEVVWVLPRTFPHKAFDGASFEQRLEMLCRIARAEPRFSVAVTDGGLYFEIAEEARLHWGDVPEIALLCGKDAAERIAGWDYGTPGVFDTLVERYPLLVAERTGEYLPEARHADRVIRVAMGDEFREVSSTELRRRIRCRMAWKDLVPAAITDLVESFYGGLPPESPLPIQAG